MNTKLVLTLLTGSVALTTVNLIAQTTPGPQPAICNRACWGARAPGHTCPGQMSALNRAIIHHTGETGGTTFNTTSQATSAANVRGIQNYDIDTLGICDIGYSFLVDKLGNIFEARLNSIASIPKTAHDCSNDRSFGFTFMGNFYSPQANQTPTTAMLNAIYDVIAWKMPSGWSPYGSSSYCMAGGTCGTYCNTVGSLDGHLNVKATACPGDNIYNVYMTGNYNGGIMRDAIAARRGGGAINNAATVSRSVPGSVTAGSTFSATITMNNNGTKGWLDVTNHKLGSQNPQDNGTWGLSRVAVVGTVNPGANYAFTFNAIAPTTPGTYAFDWKMLEESVQWFGATSTGNISVTAPVSEVIVDNAQAGFTASASWITATSSTDKYGANYRYRSTAAVSDNAVWTGSLPSSKTYNVYAWWAQGANRSISAVYHIDHAAGTTTSTKNQQGGGGAWQLLGSWSINSGSRQVRLSCWTTTGYIVVADAIKWQ